MSYSKILPKIRHLAGMVLLAAIYYYFFVYDVHQHIHKKPPLLKPSLLFIACTSLIFYMGMAHRWLWALVWGVFCISGFLVKYAIIHFNARVDINTISLLFLATTEHKILTILNSLFSLYLFYGIALSIVGYLFMLRIRGDKHYKYTLLESLGAITIITVFIYFSSVKNVLPYNLFRMGYYYSIEVEKIKNLIRSKKNIGKIPATLRKNAQDPLYVVLVIGESARGDHFSLNGYERETNPFLQALDNIVSHPRASSCTTWTHLSVPCLLTRAVYGNLSAIYHETSIISVFKALGFETTWLSGQGTFWKWSPMTFLRHESEYSRAFNLRGGYDGVMLPDYKTQIHRPKPQFLVMHLEGSHFHYQDRYPKEFRKFTPVCPTVGYWVAPQHQTLFGKGGCGRAGIINAYDNSIYYTDWLLAEVIKELKDKNALFLYVSDHGQGLGENGKYTHGYLKSPPVWHIPMIWWASDRFIELHPDAWNTLQATRTKKVSHDNVFHSLLGCIGVKSKLVNQKLNLCNAQQTPEPLKAPPAPAK